MDLKALDFKTKTIWVTGAYQGIGREIAHSFVALGGKVLGFDKQFTKQESCDGFLAVPLDLAQGDEVEKVARQMLQEHGPLDVLVNAAAVLHMGGIESLELDAWHHTFAVNVSGVFHLLRCVVPVFKKQKSGAVVTIASNAAHIPRKGMTAYSSAKAALVALSQDVALDLAPYGVRCNIVSPGSTDTPMQRSLWTSEKSRDAVIAGDLGDFRLGIPLGKIAQPKDVANLVVFLASDLAGHIVMQDIIIDGGATLGV